MAKGENQSIMANKRPPRMPENERSRSGEGSSQGHTASIFLTAVFANPGLLEGMVF